MKISPDFPLETGQIWTYANRPHETASRVLIQQVGHSPTLGEIVHIGVIRVALNGPDGTVDVITHLPYSGPALRQCLLELESSGNALLEDYAECYADWREAFESGEAGVFTLDVAGILDGFESA